MGYTARRKETECINVYNMCINLGIKVGFLTKITKISFQPYCS